MDTPEPRGWPEPLLLGAHHAGLATAMSSGTHVRLLRNCYVRAQTWLDSFPSQRFHLMVAAKHSVSPHALFCSETALFLAGLQTFGQPENIHMAVRHRGHTGTDKKTYTVPATSEHHGRLLTLAPPVARRHVHPGTEEIELDGFFTLPLQEAFVEAAATLPLQRSLGLLDTLAEHPAALGVHLEEVAALASRLPTLTARRQAALALSLADPRSESIGESASRALIYLHGFTMPLLQEPMVDLEGNLYRPDFFWPEQRIIGEFDGRMKYTGTFEDSPTQALWKEKRREIALLPLANRIIRWTWEDLKQPEKLVRILRSAGVPQRA